MIISLVPQNLLTKEQLGLFEKETGESILSFADLNEALKFLPEADILIVFGRIDKEALKICSKLKWLFSVSAGVEHLPFTELKEKGVIVTNTRGIHGEQISEHVFGMVLSFSRQLMLSRKNQLQKKWAQLLPVDELPGKTLCIIGAGSIGSEIARKAKAFDMHVIGLKKHPEAMEYFDDVFGIEKLHDVLGLADYAVLITPLTDETYHIMGAEEFKAMKRTGVFINMSRGDTVDEASLIDALRNGIIAGAGLDVFHTEPLPPESPLWEMENVIITPHNSGVSPHYFEKTLKVFRESLALYRQGKELPNRIDLERKY